MNNAFKTIGIFARVKNPEILETLKTLITYLNQSGHAIFIEKETAESLTDSTIPTLSRDALGKQCDLLIVVGGDGSLLNAAHMVVDQRLPVLGINRGNLGFLTDIHPTELTKIQAILQGHYHLEKRFLLTAQIELNKKNIGEDNALNEVALIPDVVPHMIEFEIYVDSEFVCSDNSDGLIIATPTGSTAYALSGGGPILHPELNAIVLVPMFSHSLSSRPIVIEGNRKITILISPQNKTAPRLTCDGQTHLKAPTGSRITISKKQELLHLVHPLDYRYYETLRSKLHWGKKLSSC